MRKKTRLLFFSPYFFPYTSGLTMYPLRVLLHMSDTFDITVLTFPHQHNLSPQEQIGKITIKRIPYIMRFSKGYISPQSLWYFWKEMRNHDMLFMNLPNVEGMPLTVLAALFKKRIIALYHCKIYLGTSVMKRIISTIVNWTSYLQLMLCDQFIAHEDYIKGYNLFPNLMHKCIFSYPPIEYIDADQEKKQQLEKMKKDAVWIGYVGRLASEKGIEYLIDGLQLLLKKRKNIALAIAKPQQTAGEGSYEKFVYDRLRSEKIPYVEFNDLSNSDLSAFYETIHVLVLPSVNMTEAFGMVQIESMMHKTPVIASNLPGIRIPIQKTKMGILVKPKNSKQIADAIERILTNRNLFSNGTLHERANKEFDIASVFDTFSFATSQVTGKPV